VEEICRTVQTSDIMKCTSILPDFVVRLLRAWYGTPCVIGVEACLWGEMLRSPARADYMLYPRLLAVAERAWHKASWESITDQNAFNEAHHKDWTQFTAALGHRELRRLDQLGVHYRLPRPGLL